MQDTRHGLLPFRDLDDKQFEALVLSFLGAGISLAVIEPDPCLDGAPRAARHSVVNASFYGTQGPGGQRGVDIVATIETGAKWVFQCKNYHSRFGATESRDALAKASTEFPTASRYFLVLSFEPTPDVRDVALGNERWEIWGGSELSVRFFNEVARPKQIEILRRCFPASSSESIIKRLFPLLDDYLVTVEEYFKKWLKEGRTFNHKAKLVGRSEILEQLHQYVDDPKLQALILPAAGGVGKSRLLREFGETFEDYHVGKRLFFVDDAARSELESDRLRVAMDSELVVVQDDAHRMESLRKHLFTTLVEKNGKVILSTRPHAVDALVSWLSHLGVDAIGIKVLHELKGLTRDERIKLAQECFPSIPFSRAEELAEYAKECTLIVTVGATLMGKGDFSPETYHAPGTFRSEVFNRLETETIETAIPETNVPLARASLRLLAVVSPWAEKELSLAKIAEVLECSSREFQEIFGRLREAGFLVETRLGWRVIPDLFADDLVYRGCYDDKGRLTPLALKLQALIAPIAGGSVLGNLAEAEWQARLRDSQRGPAESILKPFWDRIREQFTAADFFNRSQLIKQWRRFSALQPERSVELAQLALALDRTAERPAPLEPEEAFARDHFRHSDVLAQVPPLLEPVALYHPKLRHAVLDLLWQTHQKSGQSDVTATDGALAAIGNIAQLRYNQTIAAPKAVLDWLDQKLQGSSAAEFCDRPSPILSVIIKPVFEREVEDSYREGKSFTVRTHALAIDVTRELRSQALALLQERVIPRGEIPILNALGILAAGLDVMRHRSPDNETLDEAWLVERKAALAVIRGLIVPHQSPRVLYRIRQILAPHAHHGKNPEFSGLCSELIVSVPDNAGMRLARVLLSNAWHEYNDYSTHPGGDVSITDDRVGQYWRTLADTAAREFLDPRPTPEGLITRLGGVVVEYRTRGMKPQCFELLAAVARLDPDFAGTCIDTLLSIERTNIDEWWPALFFAQHHFPEERLMGWIRTVLAADNPVRWRPLLTLVGWAGIGEIPKEMVVLIGEWAARLRDGTMDCALSELQWSDDRKAPLNEAILCNLSLGELSEATLTKIAGALARAAEIGRDRLPEKFVKGFIHELRRVPRLDEYEERPFVTKVASLQPLQFLEMLMDRIAEVKGRGEEGEKFLVLPLTSTLVMSALPGIPGYEEQAIKIFAGLRAADEEMQYWWRLLFQGAVLRVSPLGVKLLWAWLPEANSAAEIQNLIRTLDFEGSMLIFQEPDLTREILKRARAVAPDQFDHLCWQLGFSASPKMRSYLGHELDPIYRYYRDAAAKAAVIHEKDPELGPLYREIERAEEADAARHRHQGALDAVEW
jgi:hypothetical protein